MTQANPQYMCMYSDLHILNMQSTTYYLMQAMQKMRSINICMSTVQIIFDPYVSQESNYNFVTVSCPEVQTVIRQLNIFDHKQCAQKQGGGCQFLSFVALLRTSYRILVSYLPKNLASYMNAPQAQPLAFIYVCKIHIEI